MAEVTMLNRLHLSDDEDDEVAKGSSNGDAEADPNRQGFDPYCSSDFEVFTSDLSPDFPPCDLLPPDQMTSVLPQTLLIDSLRDGVSDCESVITCADPFDRENQINFVMDLFQQRVEQSQFSTMVIDSELLDPVRGLDPDFGILEGNEEMGPTQLDLDLGLGFVVEAASRNAENSGFVSENFDGNDHFVTGLRLVDGGLDSDSDVNLDDDIDFNADADDHENDDARDEVNGDDPNLRLCWDSLQIEDDREVNEHFEWEEVDEGVDEREVLSMFLDDDDDDDVSVTALEERVGMMGNLEWEVLLNVRTLEPTQEIGHEGFNEFSFDDHEQDMEYELLFGQFTESENAIMGRPPAARNVVKNLPMVVLSEEDSGNSCVICAVCKDEMGVGKMVRQLPCNHRFHGDCILPWLDIRNTCPVCRYELPTDDPDYERRRDQSAGRVH